MLDNLANMVLLVSLLEAGCGLPASFSLRYMIPGTALGVVVGDLAFTAMAFRLARQTGAGRDGDAAGSRHAEHVRHGLFCARAGISPGARQRGLERDRGRDRRLAHRDLVAGLQRTVQTCLRPLAGWVRRSLPRAGLLGSLAAIALVLISFLPLLDILHDPIVGLVALTLILTTLIARVELPLRHSRRAGGAGGGKRPVLPDPRDRRAGRRSRRPCRAGPRSRHMPGFRPSGSVPGDSSGCGAAREAVGYLPVVIPFALATVVGGIDCTESAAAAGDEFDTRRVIAVEAVATLVAAICGGVIQTTPFIGHPAYKAMGGGQATRWPRLWSSARPESSAIFRTLYAVLPLAAVYPILVFIGLEITAQSFAATDRPALSGRGTGLRAGTGLSGDDVRRQDVGRAASWAPAGLAGRWPNRSARCEFCPGGFIVTSLLWASALAALVDRRLARAAVYLRWRRAPA